jgi:hypothetical protein
MLHPNSEFLREWLALYRQSPARDVLSEVGDPLQVAGIRIAAMISRRSTAIGWRRAITRIARSSMTRCSSSTFLSASITS